jgi:FAD/FMN-containing dehydrogenase
VRELKFDEMECSVPAAAGPTCFRAVREHTHAELALPYPEFQRFRRLRAKLDPTGTFANAYLRELFGIV